MVCNKPWRTAELWPKPDWSEGYALEAGNDMGRANRKCEAERRSCSSMFFLFWPFPFPRSPLHNARLREEGEGGKGVRESTRGGHFGEIPPPPLSTLTPVHRHWTLVKLSNCWLKTGCCDVQRALSSLVRWLQKMFFFLIVFTAICVENTLKRFQILCDTPALCCVCRVDRNMSPVGWCCYIPVGGVSRNNPCNSRTVATVPTCFIEYIHAVLWRVLSKNYLAGLISKFVLIVEEKRWL